MADSIILTAFFTENGSPKTGLTPTIDILGEDGSTLVNSESMTEIGKGFYKYKLGGYESDNNYFILADGGKTLRDSERYVPAVNAPIGGGGGGLTGDMVFTLKKIADNIATKKDIKTFVEKITGSMIDIKDNINKKESQSKGEISKMNAVMEDKIDFLIKNTDLKSKKEIESIIIALKADVQEIDLTLKTNKQEFSNMLKMNETIRELIQSVDTKEDLMKIKEQLDSNKSDFKEQLDSNKQNIILLKEEIKNTDKTDELVQMSDSIVSFTDDLKNISNEISLNLPKVFSENLSKFTGKMIEQDEKNKKNFEGMNEKLNELSKQVIQRKKEMESSQTEVEKKLSSLDSSFEIKSDENNKSINNLKSELVSMNSNIANIHKVKQNLKDLQEEIKELNLKSAHKKDISFISNDLTNKIDKLHKKMIEGANSTKNQLINISKKSRPIFRDDIAEVTEQMRMLESNA